MIIDIYEALERAKEATGNTGINTNVELPHGSTFRFAQEIKLPGNVSFTSTGKGIRSIRLIYEGPSGESVDNPAVLISRVQGYGAFLNGMEIVARPDRKYLRFVNFSNNINCKISNLRIAHYGLDCIGLDLAGRESTIVENIDVRCSVPLALRWGDNFNLHNLDLGAATTSDALAQMNKDLISTCILMTHKMDHLVLSGYQTYQGGNYAIYGRINSSVFCSGMFFERIRYEQSLSRNDPNIPAIDIEFSNLHCESMTIGAGCRFTDRKNSINIKKVWNLEVSNATRITGQRVWNNMKWDYNTKQWVLIDEQI